MLSLLRHRVVKARKYFADIEAIARTVELVSVPRLSSSSLLLSL